MQGGPVLLVHGLIGHMRVPAVFERLGERAHAPDLLGYGEQRSHAGEISLRAQVQFLNEYCIDRDLHDVHVAGHSIGGAIAVLFAKRHPELVATLTSIEGNFTLKDAFWSKRISESPIEEVEIGLEADRRNPEAWLERSGVTPTPARVEAARSHLEHQPAPTVSAMAKSVVEITAAPEYLEDVAAVIDRGIPFRLMAGERSASAWDVPAFVRARAKMVLIPKTGHLVTIESPQAFAEAFV